MNSSRKDIQVMLEETHSKSQRDKIVDYVGESSLRMNDLMYFFLDGSLHWRFNQRAAWPICEIGKSRPSLIQPYLKEMVSKLGSGSHDAVDRNIVRIFEDIEIPEEIEGQLYEKCFNFLIHPEYPIAVRCFSITVLFKIAKKYSEMLSELKETLLLFQNEASAGFKNRSFKTIAKIDKLLKGSKFDPSSN